MLCSVLRSVYGKYCTFGTKLTILSYTLEWSNFWESSLKRIVLVPMFTITNFLVSFWIILLFEILVANIVHGIKFDSHHEIDLIKGLHILNSTQRGLELSQGFQHFSPAIHLFGDSRQLILPFHVYEKAAYLITQSNEFTFLATLKQDKRNTGSIISFSDGTNRFLELQSSGRRDEIRLHYRHNNIVYSETFPYNLADEQWHRIALSVSSIQVELYIDCNRVYKREIHEIDRDLSHSNISLWLGQRNSKHFLYRGYLQEVKIISRTNGYITQCPHLETNCPTCGQFNELSNSVSLLENHIKILTERLIEAEKRLSQLESCNCLKSCHVNGTVKPDGSKWQNDCDTCSCVHGKVICQQIQCPPVPCKYPDYNSTYCCPQCKRSCFLNKKAFQHGETYRIPMQDRCSECTCNDGKATCRQVINCPELNCPVQQQISIEGVCCKICSGFDFCGAGHDCQPNSTCYNLNTMYTCKCNDGFHQYGKSCKDINECLKIGGRDGHHCRKSSKCVNLMGSYRCECLSGYTRLDKYNCIDIDECSRQEHDCHANAICNNTPGSYECRCKPGFSGNGISCEPICEQSCANGGTCIGNNTCSCRSGFFGQTCEIDIDECALGLHQCHSNSECVNKPGWYYCQCKEGYTRKMVRVKQSYVPVCEDIDECALGIHTCHGSAHCVNTDGGFECKCSPSVNNPLCSYDCIQNGKERANGSSWNGDESCMRCSCNKGIVSCQKPECNCNDPHMDIKCCPHCDTRTFCHNQKVASITYRTGQTWIYDCQICECMFGEIDCWDMECPPIGCANPVRKEGDCCPHCEDDPCDTSAQSNVTSHYGCKHLGTSYKTGEKIMWKHDPCASCKCNVPLCEHSNGRICCTYSSPCINDITTDVLNRVKRGYGEGYGEGYERVKDIHQNQKVIQSLDMTMTHSTHDNSRHTPHDN